MVVQVWPDVPQLTPEQAEHWVAAALAEAKALRHHDGQLFPATSDSAALETSERVRDAWRAWAEGAEALLARVRPLIDAQRHVPGVHDLDYTIGRTRAMLGLAPQVMQQRREQVRSGQVRGAEEVRRELRAAPGR